MSPLDSQTTGTVATTARSRPSILLLVAMTGLGPFSMQIVIPSLPAMATALGVSYGTLQLTLTLYLVGVALGQLAYGPLSDRFGRKPLLLIGLVLYVLGSVAAAIAPDVASLIAARILQAVGGCAGLVLGRAMIRDAFPRDRAASVLGYVSTAMSVAPMLAPLIGSLLAERFGWRASMVACLAFGIPLLFAIRARLPETLVTPVAMPGLPGMVRAYLRLLRVPLFRAYTAICALSTGVFFAFAAGGPLVVIQGMGMSATRYATAMILISLAWSAGTLTAARLSPRLGVARMLRAGTVVTVGGGLLALGAALLLPPSLGAFFLPMAVVAFGNGITQPNAIAAAISVRPALAGTASGLLGAAQMGTGALFTVLSGYTEGGSGVATATWMLVSGAATLPFLMQVLRR